MKTSPWHSALEIPPHVYHDETECGPGSQIKYKDRISGTGGLRYCLQCANIERARNAKQFQYGR